MAQMTVLEIAQEFCRRQALPPPSSVVAAQDDTTRQIHGLLNEGITELTTRYQWQQLITTKSFVHANGTEYLAFDLDTLPDFHSLCSHTLWDTNAGLEVTGPLDEVEWAALVATTVASANFQFRLKNNKIYIYGVPAVPASVPFTFSYLSQYGVYNPTLAANEEMYTDDASVPRLPVRIILADIKWRWKANKGLPYAEDLRICEAMILDTIGREPNSDLVLDESSAGLTGGPNLLVAAGSWPL